MKPRSWNQGSRVARDGRPWQLRGPRPRRRVPRPLIDELPFVDVRGLGRRRQFPPNWHDTNIFDVGFLHPGIKSLRLTRASITVTYYGNAPQQIIKLKWYKPGFGGYRPVGQCGCGRTAFRLYKVSSKLVCYRCTKGRYATQVGYSRSRPHIQARRLENLISGLPRGLWGTTHKRLWSQYHALKPQGTYKSKLITERVLQPRSRYRLRSTAIREMYL
jgi:hypothetical protein